MIARHEDRKTRREFLKASVAVPMAASAAPWIIPSGILGANAPSSLIQIGIIGTGRIAREHDIPGVLKHDSARIVAVCDLDSKRCLQGKQFVENASAKRGIQAGGVKTYADYRELLQDKGIDAVMICTPDHWHAKPVIDAVRAGKDVYLEKPASLTIAEGRAMSDAVRATDRIFQQGSQQRSANNFRLACELVRNGRIGKLNTVKIGLPTDPAGDEEAEMPVPANLNYDYWLGSTPWVYYTEKRVHPQNDYSRPGWLRCEQFGAGMITGWGAHHLDIAHWGMGTELTGPVQIEATAEFPSKGLWNVHGNFSITAVYANGVTMLVSSDYPVGVRFEGSEGWIFVTRAGGAVTSSDPVAQARQTRGLDASDPKVLTSEIGPGEIHLYSSGDHHGNWLECIRSRKPTVCPVEVGHRSNSACLLGQIAMKVRRKLSWDPAAERFIHDDEANAMIARPARDPYGLKS